MKLSRGTTFALLVAVIGILFWMAIGSNVVGAAYERDFLNLYTGGLLARMGYFSDLYDFKLQTAIEDALVPNLSLHFPFVRPPFYALLLAPFTLIPVHIAFQVWLLLQTGGMFVAWAWAWRRFGPETMVYCAFFLPASLGIAHGQDCIVLLLEMLVAWTLLEKRKDTLAGLVLSLTLFKFHLFLLLPLAILLRRRWKLLGGYAGGGTALALLSLALVGPAGVRGYLALLTRKDLETLSPSPEMMVGMNAIAVNLGLNTTWATPVLMLAVVALVVWSALRADSDLRWFWTAVIGSMMLSPHTYEYDLSSLLIPALIAASTVADRRLRVLAAVTLMPLAYFFTIAGAPWAIAPSVVVVGFLVALSGVLPAVSPLEVHPAVRRQSPVS